MKVILPTPRRFRKAWADLKQSRAEADPLLDQKAFDEAWAGKQKYAHDSEDFQNGEHTHQKALKAWLEFEYDRRMKALDAVTNEAANYLNTFVLFLVAAGLVAQPQIQQYVHSPYVVTVWLPAVALIMLLRSHASPLRSLLDNYVGPGTYGADKTSEYAVANALRNTLRRRNTDMQRAKRKLAIVCLLYQACIVGVCLFLTVSGLMAMFA